MKIQEVTGRGVDGRAVAGVAAMGCGLLMSGCNREDPVTACSATSRCTAPQAAVDQRAARSQRMYRRRWWCRERRRALIVEQRPAQEPSGERLGGRILELGQPKIQLAGGTISSPTAG